MANVIKKERKKERKKTPSKNISKHFSIVTYGTFN